VTLEQQRVFCLQDIEPLSVVHIGGDEVQAFGFRSMPSCMRSELTADQLKQRFIGDVVRRAGRLGVAVQVEIAIQVNVCLSGAPGNVWDFDVCQRKCQ